MLGFLDYGNKLEIYIYIFVHILLSGEIIQVLRLEVILLII